MAERAGNEAAHLLPKDILPITDPALDRLALEVPTPTRRVGGLFIAAYAAAYFGIFIALLTPVIVGLALRMTALDQANEGATCRSCWE